MAFGYESKSHLGLISAKLATAPLKIAAIARPSSIARRISINVYLSHPIHPNPNFVMSLVFYILFQSVCLYIY